MLKLNNYPREFDKMRTMDIVIDIPGTRPLVSSIVPTWVNQGYLCMYQKLGMSIMMEELDQLTSHSGLESLAACNFAVYILVP